MRRSCELRKERSRLMLEEQVCSSVLLRLWDGWDHWKGIGRLMAGSVSRRRCPSGRGSYWEQLAGGVEDKTDFAGWKQCLSCDGEIGKGSLTKKAAYTERFCWSSWVFRQTWVLDHEVFFFSSYMS